MSESSGFLYVATGEKYHAEAVRAAESIRRFTPAAQIACIVSEDFDEASFGVFSQVIRIERKGDLQDRVASLYACSPFERTVAIDTDTVACDDLSPLFDILDHFDLAIGYTPFRDPIRDIPHAMRLATEYNGGLIAFKKNGRVSRFMERWRELYLERRRHYAEEAAPREAGLDYTGDYASNDQHSLSIALIESDLRYFTLAPEWNVRAHSPYVMHGKCKLLHYRKVLDLAEEFNKTEEFRVWLPYMRRCLTLLEITQMFAARTLRNQIMRRFLALFGIPFRC